MKQRLSVAIRGAVQGVGFRPFVYRLATRLKLSGWVANSPQGVLAEVEGDREALEEFLIAIDRDRPPLASIRSLEPSFLDPAGYDGFVIRPSEESGDPTAIVLPDIAVCPDCLEEMLDSSDRRYRYPFINCTNCGPRYSIIEALPYDRPNTSMKSFVMCDRCREEYEDPHNRRFHAQPIACPDCGPQVEIWNADGSVLSTGDAAVVRSAAAIREGRIVAVKGVGGFHLLADAGNEEAIALLRSRKHREEKPLAVMAPSLETVRESCEVNALEERLLTSPESPIVLLRRKEGSARAQVAGAVAPGNPYLGVLLPYSPLHHLLMREIRTSVVATSGNLSEEPICTDEREALDRLRGIADLFLVHDRPIVRHVDDSVDRIVHGRELVVRRARGYAPLPVEVGGSDAPEIFAVGAHLKNAIALGKGGNAFISQHIGDLGSVEAFDAFREVHHAFGRLFDAHPDIVASDLHPAYRSTLFAAGTGLAHESIQHHYAHLAACMADNRLEGRVLGVTWDGTGYGPDGTIWGGEFLLTDAHAFRRVASLKQFPLPGGEEAIRHPGRAALGLLVSLFGEELAEVSDLPCFREMTGTERAVVLRMLARRINSPLTSSAGRLFDAVASMIGVRQTNSFEGQAAMELEFAASAVPESGSYPFSLSPRECTGDVLVHPRNGSSEFRQGIVVDWSDLIRAAVEDVRGGTPAGVIAAKFHNTLAEMIVAVARRIGEPRVLLTGGCFQNALLTERTIDRLGKAGFRAYWHQRIPPNDGGIAVGQIAAVRRQERRAIARPAPFVEQEL